MSGSICSTDGEFASHGDGIDIGVFDRDTTVHTSNLVVESAEIQYKDI